MNHPFLSRRHVCAKVHEASALGEDLVLLSRMTPDDHALVARRRDTEIKDDVVREVTQRRAARLGLLMDDFAVAVAEAVPGATVSDATRRAWDDFVVKGPPPSKKSSPSSPSPPAWVQEVETVLQGTRTTLAAARVVEHDSGSSSPSDYSDSRTDTDTDDESRHD